MGVIKTVCTGKKEPLEVSLKHTFPTGGKNSRKPFSSDFVCPYAHAGGTVTCCYPNKIDHNSRKSAWLFPIQGEQPLDFETQPCPVYRNLVTNYAPNLSLNGTELYLPPSLLDRDYANLSEDEKTLIKETKLT